MSSNTRRPNRETFHRVRMPCEVLRNDFMVPNAMTAEELARRTDLPK